jgi:fibronectin type 3 domain-containing protein
LAVDTNREIAGMYKILSLLLTFGMLCSMVSLAEAGTVTLGWDRSTEADLAGYRIYYGDSPRAQTMYSQTVPINNKYATSWQLTLPDGVYYFALTAVDLAGNESGFSNEVVAEISEAPPEAPPVVPLGKPGMPILIQ